MSTMTYDDVVAALEEIVSGRENTVVSCRYADPDGSPVCIVGHFLHRHLPEAFKWASDDDQNWRTIHSIHKHSWRLPLDENSVALLSRMQNHQDDRIPWGRALAMAVKAVPARVEA